ncbi:MAG: HNH endonuclease [Bacteroidales bacterium]|nr:HNH endonuclease [Bacteroidales bacterium]
MARKKVKYTKIQDASKSISTLIGLNYSQSFLDEQSDFFQYMKDQQLFKSNKTYHDYLSRLRFVAQYYNLDKSLTESDVSGIIADLKATASTRERYNTPKGISDIASGLKRFLEYIKSDYRKVLDQSILAEEEKIINDSNIPSTERESLIRARIGQGKFRNDLIQYWGGCSVTKCGAVHLLVASHIQPWRKCANFQRLDVFNGLLLTPNLDKLFDKGYISFDAKGRIICSNTLSQEDMKALGIVPSMCLARIDDLHKPYLKYHRENCLL